MNCEKTSYNAGDIKPTNSALDQFFRAYGSAMFAWQEVETGLYKLYHSMNVLGGERDIMVSAKAYYKKKSFGSKLDEVNRIAKIVCVEKYIDWVSLKDDLKHESAFRNSLAHSPVQLAENQDGSISLVLGDPIFFPSSLREIPTIAHKYDTNKCFEIKNCFEKISKRIDDARKQIPSKFKNNKLIIPEEDGPEK
jgi:hypothetical protein